MSDLVARVSGMRFVATADWQLGMTAHYLGAEARPRFAQARVDVIRRIGRVAVEHDAQFVLVCGDVFESNQLDRLVIARAFDALDDVPVPVWLLPGNHDPLDASSLYRSREFLDACPPHVHVLDRPGVHEAAPGIEIVAAPWFGKSPLSDLVADALADVPAADGVLRVVAGHGTTLGIDRDDPAGISETALIDAFDDGRAHVAIIGDRHSTTRVHERIWYPGAPEVTHRREVDPGNVLVVDVDEHDIDVRTVPVGIWRFVRHDAAVDSLDDVERLHEWLGAQPAKAVTAVWLALTGTLTVGAKARLDDVLEAAGDLYARVDLWQRHTDLVVLPAEGEFDELGLSGFAQQAVDELVARLEGDEGQAARDALGLLYRLSRGGV